MISDRPVDHAKRRQIGSGIEGLYKPSADHPRSALVVHHPHREDVDAVVKRGGVEHAHESRVLGIRIGGEAMPNIRSMNPGHRVTHRQPIDHDLYEIDGLVIQRPTGNRKDAVHRLVGARQLELTEGRLVAIVVDRDRSQAVVLSRFVGKRDCEKERMRTVRVVI